MSSVNCVQSAFLLSCPRCPVVKCVRLRVCCSVVFGTLVGVIVFNVMYPSC